MGFRIGCLAWGSLVWDPRTLPMAGEFRDDGPRLPIEFSRVSLDGRVTLVIDPTAREIQTLWVPLAARNLEEAVTKLGIREKIAPAMRSQWVGRLSVHDSVSGQGDRSEILRQTITAWLEDQALDAVVWTALPSRAPDGEAKRPHFDHLLAHLKSLDEEARGRAEEYIRRAPGTVQTAYRSRFEEILGWLPANGDD
jgi:hypothetical protein